MWMYELSVELTDVVAVRVQGGCVGDVRSPASCCGRRQLSPALPLEDLGTMMKEVCWPAAEAIAKRAHCHPTGRVE